MKRQLINKLLKLDVNAGIYSLCSAEYKYIKKYYIGLTVDELKEQIELYKEN